MNQFPRLIDAYTAPRGTLVRAIGASRSGHFIDATGYVVIGARRLVDGNRPSTPDDQISLVLNERADETGTETTVILPAGGKVFALPAHAATESDEKPCAHVWVAGMMYVDSEDVAAVAAVRQVECESCGVTYSDTTARRSSEEWFTFG